MKEATHYDIIGDIHGRHDKLGALMERLGYQPAADGGFVPPAGHMALFLGDLIDTKPGCPWPGGVRATLRAVKAMCDRGDALCLMGNHEWNAICYHTEAERSEDGWLRSRKAKNTRIHQGTLDDFPDHDDPAGEWRQVWLPWMKRLPFYLDLGGLRAVHATWHPDMIGRVAGLGFACDRFLAESARKETCHGEALEMLLKGIEIDLPGEDRFPDAEGVVRPNMRVKWWVPPRGGETLADLVFPTNSAVPATPVKPALLAAVPGYPPDAPPVFFGHYFKPAASPLRPEAPNVACLDHAAGKDGPLVAYRWKGEATIDHSRYVASHAPPGASSSSGNRPLACGKP